MQTILLDNTAIDIPSYLEWRDDDGTLVAYPPNTDYANLRFSLTSIRDKAGDYVPEAGVSTIARRCQEASAVLESKIEKVWYCEEQGSTDGSPGSVIHYWYVGMDAHFLVISCFIDGAQLNNANAIKVLASVPATIDSFRKVHDA